MSVKVFIGQPTMQGFQVDPPNVFRMIIDFQLHKNEPEPAHDTGSFIVDMPPGATPYEVYATVFQKIVEVCQGAQYPIPTKNDIFGYIPTPFAALLPDMPSFT
jgi:hypothetical protein